MRKVPKVSKRNFPWEQKMIEGNMENRNKNKTYKKITRKNKRFQENRKKLKRNMKKFK